MMREKAMETGAVRRREKPAVVVRNVTKEFAIPHDRKTTLFESAKGFFSPSTYERFAALDDVSLTVERGESIGLIGDNGSGKSTLLKIIANIIRPTSGSIEVNGKITPFLELGVGFQPDLTARENIEVYSTIMGLSQREIDRNMDGVLEFAGLTRFRDTKLKNFSSGMYVRLAFATAVQKLPDILLVDEVLAVGDIEFQQKCLDMFTEYKKMGVTMLFVSHDLGTIRRFCDKAVLMRDGKLVACGKSGDIIDRYVYGIDRREQEPAAAMKVPAEEPASPATSGSEASAGTTGQEAPHEKKDRWGNQKAVITGVAFRDKYGREGDRFNSGDPMSIRISYHAVEPIGDPVFGIAIYGERDLLVYGTNTDVHGIAIGEISGDGHIDFTIPSLSFVAGKFLLTVAIHARDHVPYDWHDKKYSFTIVNTGQVAGLVDLKGEWIHG